MPTVHLIGGGWDLPATAAVDGSFLEATATTPVVATLVSDEGDGAAQSGRWAGALRRTAVAGAGSLGQRLGPEWGAPALTRAR